MGRLGITMERQPSPRSAIGWVNSRGWASAARSFRILALALFAITCFGCSEVDRLRWTARMGRVDAQRELGTRLVEGDRMERDFEAGIGWLERAAEGGSTAAQLQLVDLYTERRTGDDKQLAEAWLRVAAEAGSPQAQVRLADLLYASGAADADDWLKRAAEAGDAEAQLRWGQRLNDQEAEAQEVIAWLEKSAEQDHAEAAWELARYLGRAQGVPQLEETALRWLHRAAEAGHTEAQAALGRAYFSGSGVEQDYGQAFAWFEAAARQGDASAQESLGLAYQQGLGAVRSGTEAARWFRLAAAQGRAVAQNQLGVMYAQGLLPDEETAEQIAYYTSGNGQHAPGAELRLDELSAIARASNDRRAVEWYRRSAEQEFAPALTNLARMLEEGRGVEKADPAEALRLLNRAAALGNTSAQAALASRYSRGAGVNRDDEASFRHYLQAAESGHPLSAYAVATMYSSGRGVEQNLEMAAKWFRTAAEGGVEAAELNYGTLLASGKGVAQNDEEALRWFQRAAERGEIAAQWNLGVFYEEGRGGLHKSSRNAVKWWTRAAEQGHPYAQVKLGLAYAEGKGTRRDLGEAYAWLVTSGSDQVANWIEQMRGRMVPSELERAEKRIEELAARAVEREKAAAASVAQ